MEEKVQIDKYGWEYFDHVPENYILATLDDFHVLGRKRIGMMFLIKWPDKEYYQVCIVSERLTGKFLYPFIEANRVFIKKSDRNGFNHNQSAN